MHPEWPPEKDTLWDVFFFGTAKGRSIDISKLVNVFIHATKHASFIRPSERQNPFYLHGSFRSICDTPRSLLRKADCPLASGKASTTGSDNRTLASETSAILVDDFMV